MHLKALADGVVEAEVALGVAVAVVVGVRGEGAAPDALMAGGERPVGEGRATFDAAALVEESARMDVERLGEGIRRQGERLAAPDAVHPEKIVAGRVPRGEVELQGLLAGEGGSLVRFRVIHSGAEGSGEGNGGIRGSSQLEGPAVEVAERERAGGSQPAAQVGVASPRLQGIADLVQLEERGRALAGLMSMADAGAVRQGQQHRLRWLQRTAQPHKQVVGDLGVPGGDALQPQQAGRTQPEADLDGLDGRGALHPHLRRVTEEPDQSRTVLEYRPRLLDVPAQLQALQRAWLAWASWRE